MPSNSPEYRKKNYMKYWGNEKAMNKRVLRNAARRLAIKKGWVRKGDNQQVDHINGTEAGNKESNLRVISATKNKQLGQKLANKIRTRIYNKT